jgi:ATP-binding cassette subfamily F protein uup
MHFLSADKIGKSFGTRVLFKNLSFHIEEKDKIALMARNGSGKSTLLKILAGKDSPDEGSIWVHKDVQIALFEQEPQFDENATILDNIFAHNHPAIKAISQYESALETGDEKAVSKAMAAMDELQAWDFEAKVKQILGKLNIHHLSAKVGNLSGGQKKRVALVKILIDIGFEHKHVLLIMDEPTNHLDIEMVEWLENFLNKEHITLLLVTHDRYFLDAVCTEIWELDDETLYTYKGDYENYLEKKTQRIENTLSSIDKAKNLYRKELEWIRKQPKARTTKSKSRIDAFEEVSAKAHRKVTDQQLKLELKMSRLGGKIAELKKLNKAYGDKVILKGFDYTFSKGERIGITGRNGTGKSTFINILQGIEQPDSGKVNIGETVVFGYYSQQGLDIKEDKRVIEYVKDIAENFPLAGGGTLSASQFLQLFLFPPEQQYTYISRLSGGEKRRLHLLSILFRNPNFLILDEPTNDLDLPTLSVLEDFLSQFQGCLILISHDRYFMDRLIDHLLVFEGDGVIRDFPGNYTQYRLKKKEEEQQEEENRKQLKKDTALTPSKEKKRAGFKEKREFEMLSAEIESLEKEKAELALKLEGLTDYEELRKISERISEITALLDEKEFRWLELSEIINE